MQTVEAHKGYKIPRKLEDKNIWKTTMGEKRTFIFWPFCPMPGAKRLTVRGKTPTVDALCPSFVNSKNN